jgi:hypothetical protein
MYYDENMLLHYTESFRKDGILSTNGTINLHAIDHEIAINSGEGLGLLHQTTTSWPIKNRIER